LFALFHVAESARPERSPTNGSRAALRMSAYPRLSADDPGRIRFSYAHTLLCAKSHLPREWLPGKVPLALGCSGLLIGAIFRSGRGRGRARAVRRHRIEKLEPALLAWDVSSSLDQVHQGCLEDGPMFLA
jgi:hypothetical protein